MNKPRRVYTVRLSVREYNALCKLGQGSLTKGVRKAAELTGATINTKRSTFTGE